MPQPPPNAFEPGKVLTVGSHQIEIRKYISEGGFAYVYSCNIDPPFNGNTTACLKRVVVPNKCQLTLLRQEVEAMKRLRGNAHIVSYIDSHAQRLPLKSPNSQNQYEVLLLMEYCSGKGLIDFMNTRLTNRLSEAEILQIASQVTTAVAMCHHLQPPLIHRDIKIENVLLDGKGTYKLCDFGSAVAYSPSPKSPSEMTLLHNDIMQNTTPQYRAPEMIDLSHGFPIDDKSDIWALGVFMYKLCYYTTPFESPHQKSLEDLQSSILNSTTNLRFPGSPQYSARLRNVIHCCLRADPRRRPNALQLLQELCMMRNVKVIPDVVPYSVRNATLAHASIIKKPELPRRVTPPGIDTYRPELPKRNSQDVTKNLGRAQTDTFATIDKSKILQMGQRTPRKPRPKSEVFSSKIPSSVQGHIRLHANESSSNIPSARKSEDFTETSTLDFLRSIENKESQSRQNTGGSFKETIKNGLRKISTGGSLSSLSSQKSGFRIPSSSERPSSDETLRDSPEKFPGKRMSSIQRKMQQLLSNKEKKPAKTASGYGKYTEQENISAINLTNLSARGSTELLATYEIRPSETKALEKFEFNQKSGFAATQHKLDNVKPVIDRLNGSSENTRGLNTPPPCPPSLSVRNSSNFSDEIILTPTKANVVLNKGHFSKKAPPPKPRKPAHLQKPAHRRASNSSEVSLPDLDDLEKQFARRFPSYV